MFQLTLITLTLAFTKMSHLVRVILMTTFLQPLTILVYVLVGIISSNCKCKEMKHVKSVILPTPSPFPSDSFEICVSIRVNAGLRP